MSKEQKETDLLTPPFVTSFPNVFEMALNKKSGKMEFSLIAMFDKETSDMSTIEAVIENLIKLEWPDPKIRAKITKHSDFRNPIRDGDEMDDEGGMAGHWYMRLKTQYKPKVVGTKKDKQGNFIELFDDSEFYAGCIARARISGWSFSEKGTGVAFSLGNIQKLADGDRIGGGASKPEDDFADTPEETDDTGGDNDWG